MSDLPGIDRRWYVYMLRCSDGSYYTGYCADLERRMTLHRGGKGSKYVRSRLPFVFIWSISLSDRSSAMRLENSVKKMTHKQKGDFCDLFSRASAPASTP